MDIWPQAVARKGPLNRFQQVTKFQSLQCTQQGEDKQEILNGCLLIDECQYSVTHDDILWEAGERNNYTGEYGYKTEEIKGSLNLIPYHKNHLTQKDWMEKGKVFKFIKIFLRTEWV